MKKLLLLLGVVTLLLFFNNSIYATSNSKSIISDGANLYTVEQEKTMMTQIANIYNDYQIDVHILTMTSIDQNEVTYINEYVKKIYNTNEPNRDTDTIVILISLKGYSNVNLKYLEVSTYGYAYDMINDMKLSVILDNFVSNVGVDKYYYATNILLDDMHNQIHATRLTNELLPHGFILVVALVISSVVVFS